MKKITKNIVVLSFLLMILLFTIIFLQNKTISPKTKINDVYKETIADINSYFVEEENEAYLDAIVNMNSDSMPELLLSKKNFNNLHSLKILHYDKSQNKLKEVDSIFEFQYGVASVGGIRISLQYLPKEHKLITSQ